jgi:hypothetical protein
MTAPAPADKSVGAALALTFFFGPIGLFYINVVGAIIMIVVSVVALPLTIGLAALIIWPICMIWSAVTAGRQHQSFEEWKIGQMRSL